MKIDEAVKKLGTTQDSDYWKPTPGNAGHALNILLTWAVDNPDAIFRVSYQYGELYITGEKCKRAEMKVNFYYDKRKNCRNFLYWLFEWSWSATKWGQRAWGLRVCGFVIENKVEG